jgi:hypothetical protein
MYRTGLLATSALAISALVAGTLAVQAAVGDPLKVIYRVTNVIDNGGASNTGVATSITCTNLSMVTETLNVVIRSVNGVAKANVSVNVGTQGAWTGSTHGTNVFFENVSLATGIVQQGNATIRATTSNMICSVVLVDAAASFPQGIALHLVRFNPMAGSQE